MVERSVKIKQPKVAISGKYHCKWWTLGTVYGQEVIMNVVKNQSQTVLQNMRDELSQKTNTWLEEERKQKAKKVIQ